MKSLGIFVIAALWGFSGMALGQTATVPQECSDDPDCDTGNCVQLKEESKKVCLYCSQSDYESYWSEVQSKCKNLDEIGRYSDLKGELQKASNQRGEFSLPWLYSRRDLNAA